MDCQLPQLWLEDSRPCQCELSIPRQRFGHVTCSLEDDEDARSCHAANFSMLQKLKLPTSCKDPYPFVIEMCNNLTIKCAAIGIFSPPPHTYQPGSNMYGCWFSVLPPDICTYAKMFWDPLLLEYFSHADVGIVTCSHPAIASVVQGRRRGYEFLQAPCMMPMALYTLN
jgi:hypothetical protein